MGIFRPRVFFSFLELKTSFFAYVCTWGQIKKKTTEKLIFDHFCRPFFKKGTQISAHTDLIHLISVRLLSYVGS